MFPTSRVNWREDCDKEMEGGQPSVADSNYLSRQAPNNESLVDFVDVLQSIDVNQPLAALNETTIADNNGGRIEL